MIVFSNTTPFIALSCIDRLDLLPTVFGRIHVADAVAEECATGGDIFVPKLTELPWIHIVENPKSQHYDALSSLDKGERHTILSAVEMNADIVIIDEKTGRKIAEHMGLSVTGTLGVLLKAKQMGKITSFADCVNAMLENGIRYNMSLVRRLASQVGEYL